MAQYHIYLTENKPRLSREAIVTKALLWLASVALAANFLVWVRS